MEGAFLCGFFKQQRTLQHGFRRIPVHSEDEARLKERWNLIKDGADVAMHPVWRDVEAAIPPVAERIDLAARAMICAST